MNEIIKEIREKQQEEIREVYKFSKRHNCGQFDNGWCLYYKQPCNLQCEEANKK